MHQSQTVQNSPEMFGKFARAYLLLIVCSLLVTYPLFQDGFPRHGDFMREIVRVAEYAHTLKAGGFPVRWGGSLEGGYGYPIYNFFPPIFMLIASMLAIAGGLSILSSIKITLFLLTLASGVGMYWFAREHFEKKGGLLAASLYILFPYHFIDIFFRSAFSEFTALAIVPFVFYGLEKLLRETPPNPAAMIVLAVSGALFILSHNLSVLMYGPLLFFYVLLMVASTRQWGKLRALMVSLLIAFALAAFYTLPLVFERQFVQLWVMTAGKYNVLNNFLSPGQLFSPLSPWLPFSWWGIALTPLGITVYYRSRIPQPTFAVLCFFILGLFMLLFLVTPASKAVWGSVELLQWFQFPWRLLSPAAFIICFLSGVIVYLPSENIRRMLMVCFVFLAVVTLIPMLSIAFRGSSALIPDEALEPAQIRKQWLSVTVLSEYLPIWVKEKPASPVEERLTYSRPYIEVQKSEESAHLYAYKIKTAGETLFTANLFYFPGWKVYVNSEELKPRITRQGLMQFSLPKGQFRVELKFENTPIRILGNSLSLAGLLALGWMLLRAARTGNNRRRMAM